MINFFNSYKHLGKSFFKEERPASVRNPELLLWNKPLAADLKLADSAINNADILSQVFSGNTILPGSEPIATAYAGHQFGRFVPMLGDGRAHLMGDILDANGQAFDIQLKGSGRTSFSRGGDGRCAIGPAVREFLMSEAMHAMGVPTSRCLAVVKTGETVFRERPLPGAVVTRVAVSHIRIGTFEFFAAQGNTNAIESLCNYTIARHYPEIKGDGTDKYISLLKRVIEKQIHLVVEWMRVGFIHGVMNTDNILLSGETIDFGPCAMMGIYDPKTVYSSIDTAGRYSFGNQPIVLQWNIARFAECLLPLIDSDRNKGIEVLTPYIENFAKQFEAKYMAMMGRKLGISQFRDTDEDLVHSILDKLKERRLDYTASFDALSTYAGSGVLHSDLKAALGESLDHLKKRHADDASSTDEISELMKRHNPVVIPRNHHMERIIRAYERDGDFPQIEAFLSVIRNPYKVTDQTADYQDLPRDGDIGYQTFCGT